MKKKIKKNLEKEKKLFLIEKLRELSISKIFSVKTFQNAFSYWKEDILQILGKDVNAVSEDKILLLGQNLRDIFMSTSSKKRGQGDLSGGGAAWECLCTWYLNLLLANTRGIVFKFSKPIFPEAIRDSITIKYNNFENTSETDLLGFVFPENQNFINKICGFNNEAIEKFNEFVLEDYNKFEVCILQCKTNWNDNAQIPFLYNLIYELGSAKSVSVGKNSRVTSDYKKFSYAFLTVPTQKINNIEKLDNSSVAVQRVRNLTGGNYWGLKSKNGIAYSLDECVNNNFRNAFDKGGIRENIKKNIKLLNSDLSYFKLF